MKYWLGLVFILIITFGYSQQNNTTLSDSTPQPLPEVTITSIIGNQTPKETTTNVSLISQNQINRSNGYNYKQILNTIPGVFMQSGALNTNRITIRGIGARSPFGTTGIRAYFGEIPLTDGNGASAIEDLELASISTIEIHKGPAASSFGVGLGGTIILQPQKAQLNTTQANLKSTFGSFGLQRYVANVAHGGNKSSVNLTYTDTQSDGFRGNNNYNRKSLTTIAQHLSVKNKITFLGNYTDLKAFIPSSVNLKTFQNNPEAAAPTWKAAKGFEDTQSLLSGISWKHSFTQKTALHSAIFTSVKKNYEPRPFNILEENLNTYGFRSRITGNTNLKNKNLNWGFGGELFWDQLKNKTFQNLYKDFLQDNGSVQGNIISQFKEKRNYFNLFAQATLQLNKKLMIESGINLNKTNYTLKDQLNSNSENLNGSFQFDAIISPKIGLKYIFNKNIDFTANISHGFAPPTTEETLLPDGERNPNLKPEKGWNYEITSNFSYFENRLQGKISVYSLIVSDLLVNRRAENDALFAINAGKTNHNGLETELSYKLLKTKKIELQGMVNYSLYHYRFKNFIDENVDFSGNKLTGVPTNIFNAGLNFTTDFGLQLYTNFQFTDQIPANDANTVFSESYHLLNFKATYATPLTDHFSLSIFSGVQNSTNTNYVSQLQVNASGFGGRAPRYFYAGDPVNFYGGINIKYIL